MSCGNIGKARKQRVFVCIEDTCGTLKFPTPSTDFILSAGNAAMNQKPAFVDSLELSDTLDVLAQFQSATGPATWTIPMYLRMTGTVGTTEYPQGDALFQSLQGSRKSATTASLDGGILADGATILLKAIDNGRLPKVGVVTIGSEKIYYDTLAQGNSSTTATLTGLTRAYNSTSAAAATSDTIVTLTSIFYQQDTDSPSVSIWIEDDHLIRGISGATANNCAVTINNEGAVMFTFSGEGMEMVWAGTSALATSSIASATSIYVDDGEIFKAGAYIWNETQADNNSGAGYEISSVVGNILTLGSIGGIDSAWATDDVIKGYLGTETSIGTAVESRLSDVYLNDVATKVRSMDLTISAPKTYITDEIGTSYPEAYMEDKRSITGSLGLYLRKADVQYFSQGFAGTTKELAIKFGDTQGYIMSLVMPRAQIEVPEISQDGAAQAMAINYKAMGQNGEDSLDIVLR
jgi:hypothetical protein